jgi:hypothetical protein
MFDLIDIVLVVVGVLHGAVGLLTVLVHFVASFLAFVPGLVLAFVFGAIHHLLVLVAGAVLLRGGRDLLGVLLEQQGDCAREKLEAHVLFVLALTAGSQEFFELLVSGLAIDVHHLLEQNLERLEVHVRLAE